MSKHDHHLSDASRTPIQRPGLGQPTLESLEPRLLLSIGVQNLLPTAPLRPVLDHLADQLEKLLPDEIRDAVMPGVNALMQSGNSNYVYLAMPNETNDVKIWGELGNTLLLTNESKDVTIFRLGTFSFQPIDKIEINPTGKVEGGGSFVAHLAGGIGLKLDGFFQSVAKQWFDLSSPRVVALNGTALVAGLDSAQVAVGYDQPLEFAAKSAVTFRGLGGHDTIDLTDAPLPAELVARILDGGPGNDILIGSAGSDQLLGGRGDDLLRGEGGDDLLSGGEGADILKGGAGDDTAELLGTAGDDAVEVADDTLVLNGVTDEFAEIETLAVHALAGNDDVFVEAGAGFPAFADIMTGDGDDNIHVLLHNPAPATSILVDGGAPQASDTATVEGMTGNDQFTEYGWVNVFGAATVSLLDIENPLILEGRRIDRERDTVEADRFVFGDADGNPAMVTITGPGSVDVLRNIFSGRSADIHRLVLIGTDPQRTRVNVRVYRAAGTDNETSIGSITGAGTVDGADYTAWADHYGNGCGSTGGVVGATACLSSRVPGRTQVASNLCHPAGGPAAALGATLLTRAAGGSAARRPVPAPRQARDFGGRFALASTIAEGLRPP